MQSEGTLYVAADYVKLFTNYSYEVFDRHLQVYTEWGTKQTYKIAKKTQVRLKGGIKSPILREMEEGEQVELLEQMETWSKVKTSDSIIGYVENKRLTDVDTEVETPVTDYVPEEYTSIALDGKVCLGFHSIGGPGGNDTLDSMVAEGKGMNVIAPTWFSFTDNAGTFRSFASGQYVEKAHSYGLKVWGVWDNFNYKNETGSDIDMVQILSSTANRQNIVEQMTATALELGLDRINIDFEGRHRTVEHIMYSLSGNCLLPAVKINWRFPLTIMCPFILMIFTVWIFRERWQITLLSWDMMSTGMVARTPEAWQVSTMYPMDCRKHWKWLPQKR